jgi:hypothetical protein
MERQDVASAEVALERQVKTLLILVRVVRLLTAARQRGRMVPVWLVGLVGAANYPIPGTFIMFGFFRKRNQAADFLRAAGEAEPERQVEVDILHACRGLFGPPPRSLSGSGDDRLALPPDLEEAFISSKDGLLKILEDQDRLLARGQVFWGHLVQANQILFDPENEMTLPANVIYSTDPFFDGRLSLLSSMARGLFAQKGSTRADRELQRFVDVITDELTRVLRQAMPHSYTGGRSVNFATCFIQPSHLPDGYLTRSSFPVVVNPEETPAMMLLPSRYWPPDLVAHWRD